MKGNKISRREMREKVFTALFESCFHKDETVDEIYDAYIKDSSLKPDEYFHNVFYGVFLSQSEIDDEITAHLEGYRLQRLSLVTLTAMRISVLEMTKLDIPYSISINEAVELIKKYDDIGPAKYANGVLNSIAKTKGLKDGGN